MNEGLDMLKEQIVEWINEGKRLLHQAVQEASLPGSEHAIFDVNVLLHGHVDINARNSNDATPLHVAAKSENLHLVKILVEGGANLRAMSMHGATPLHNACREGSDRIVAYLIRAGSDKDALTLDRDTPLHHAVRFNKIENIRILILFGANPRIKNRRGEHPMNLRCLDETKSAFKNALKEKTEMDHTRNVEGVNRSSLYD